MPRITDYPALAAASVAAADVLPIVDVDDLTQSPAGTTKQVTVAGLGMLRQVASTGPNGHALVNGTGTILSWQAPADGNPHPVLVFATLDVTSGETGGEVDALLTFVDGNSAGGQLFSPNLGVNTHLMINFVPNFVVAPGSTFQISQGSALTSGAARLDAQIWAA